MPVMCRRDGVCLEWDFLANPRESECVCVLYISKWQ